MLMTGIGNTKAHMDRTLDALREIAETGSDREAADERRRRDYHVPEAGKLRAVPEEKILFRWMKPREESAPGPSFLIRRAFRSCVPVKR